jgi:mono/diheme cytochrome c family protein
MIKLPCLALALGLSLGLAVPPAARAAETPLDGKKLFASSCGFCHSKGGRKAGKGPKLANSPRSDAFIVTRIKNGKQGRMPAFARAFDDAKIKAILAYIRSLDDPAQ